MLCPEMQAFTTEPGGAENPLGAPALSPNDTWMADELTAEDVRNLLDLEPNGGLPSPFGDGRPVGSALYFMVTPTAPVRLHRIRNDQLYHYYLGDPLEVFLLRNDGSSERVIVGPDLRGERIQLFIPGTPSILRG
jgi:uncharacterized protein